MAPVPPGAAIQVWGFQAGCEIKDDLTKSVLDRLFNEHHYRTERLTSPMGKPLPPCPGSVQSGGAGCMAAIKESCPLSSGLLLGGAISRKAQATRIRLWLYDLRTQAQAVRDDYCQQCDPDDGKVLTAHAAAFLRDPGAASVAAPQPGYCQGEPPSAPHRESTAPLYVGIVGSGSHRDFIRRELLGRVALKRSGQGQPVPLLTDQKGADPVTFDRITQGQEGAQVLRIELGGNSVELLLWDQRSRRLATRSIACRDGCRDELENTAQAAAELLDICFADGCAQAQAVEHRPPEACTAFEDTACPALSSALAAGGTGRLDAGVARRIEALVGLGVGLGAATAAGMWIANSTVQRELPVQVQTPQGPASTTVPVRNLLTVPAGITTGLAAGLAVLAVPTFVFLERAKRQPPVAAMPSGHAAPPLAIRCPEPNSGLLGRSQP
jgi:hypothetical protein